MKSTVDLPQARAGASLPLAVLERFLRTIPDPVHAELACRIGNHLLRGQAFVERLVPIEGRRLHLVISDTGNTWRFRVQGGRLCAQSAAAPADVRIRGELLDFLLLATRVEDPDTLFFARRLCLEGDTETGLHVKNALDALEFDWDVHVGGVVGARAAGVLHDALRRSGADRSLASALHRLAGHLAARAAARD